MLRLIGSGCFHRDQHFVEKEFGLEDPPGILPHGNDERWRKVASPQAEPALRPGDQIAAKDDRLEALPVPPRIAGGQPLLP